MIVIFFPTFCAKLFNILLVNFPYRLTEISGHPRNIGGKYTYIYANIYLAKLHRKCSIDTPKQYSHSFFQEPRQTDRFTLTVSFGLFPDPAIVDFASRFMSPTACNLFARRAPIESTPIRNAVTNDSRKEKTWRASEIPRKRYGAECAICRHRYR